ncbi:lysine-specific demethylase JMJ28 isoform X2 [Humulus lupulus]|uniref:lysine-specific demethylase JMJ28 isoform X2 n=1 Tax=Humulus lupulus TaxID=3486 RepID=UPI002B401D79|nr:lysine-specific demethylase JMJ28 isoform X2 [Humulus lupulus]
MEEDEPLPDNLRCNRTDGRQWRCKRRVMEKMKLCEIHYLQGRHRQNKEVVPESLKLQRTTTKKKKGLNRDKSKRGFQIRAKKEEILAKLMMKRKRSGETLRTVKKLKRGNTEMELIRMVLKREVEKSTEKSMKSKTKTKTKKNKVVSEKEDEEDDDSEEELTRDLPNGLMAISSSSSPSPQQCSGNVGSDSPALVKVGVDFRPVQQRRFRSKNIEALPYGKLQVLPCARNVGNLGGDKRKKRCHWCQRSGSRILIKCSSCQKHFFCLDCIKERYFNSQEVKDACPVCRKICTCKDCLENPSKDSESKDFLGDKHEVEVILCFHYLICMLLPVLKQINKDQNDELEIEARIRGQKPSDLHIKQADTECSEQHCCNRCKGFILDLHRSCPNCSYNLCLSCCRDLRQESFFGCTNFSIQMCSNKSETLASANMRQIEKPLRTRQNSGSKYLESSVSLPEWKVHNGNGDTSCPPREYGGCGENLLELRFLLPLNWTKELEVSAEQIVCSYDVPETSDISLCCSLCNGMNQKVGGRKQLQEAAVREDSSDNFLYYPTLLDVHGDKLEHFQKHWLKGHPVIVRNVLPATSRVSWDPILMFCTYLERSISRYENNKDLCEVSNCLDWCEVEIGIKQYFMGSFKGQTHKNTWNETLKLRGWLSSQLFQQQFPSHYAEIIHTLPLQEYMNPASGLLNLTARLPKDIQKPDLGPCVYISYGYTEQLVQADSVLKLCYDSYDMVNILAHTSDVPISSEQLSRIRKLLKKHKAQQSHMPSSKITSDQNIINNINGKSSSLHGEEIEDSAVQDLIGEEMHLRKKIARVSCSSAATQESWDRNLKESNSSLDVESDSDSETLLPSCESIHGSETSEDRKSFKGNNKSSNHDGKKSLAVSDGAQWDVFRRQDVPKLIDYLKRHSNEFACHKQVDHPILDQSFFLDTTHKMRLKEEFEIEPWTFMQHVGEAVIIPAGCPYQIKSPKACVHVVLDFMSPENVTECAQLSDEIRLLPEDHKAKVDKLQVKKMALHSISAAIQEIRELTCATCPTFFCMSVHIFRF